MNGTHCPNCFFESSVHTSKNECVKCGIIFEKFQSHRPYRQPALKHAEPSTWKKTLPWWTELVVFLGLVCISWTFTKTMPILSWKLSIWVHEFVHALPSWFSGIAATPLPIGWTNTAAQQSWWVTLCFSFLMISLGVLSFQAKAYFFALSCACGFLAQLYFRFLDYKTIRFWITYMGQGGEYLVSAWLIMAFHHKLPRETYWDILKYPVTFIALITFIENIETWFGVFRHGKEIPWGALWGDGGDMERLRGAYGWSHLLIGSNYYKLGILSLLLLSAHYMGVWIYKALTQDPIDLSRLET